MNYTFKLSQRMARFRHALPIATLILGVACAGDPSEPGSTDTEAPGTISISPDAVSLGVNQSFQFDVSSDSSGVLSLARRGKGRGSSKPTIVSLAVTPQTTKLNKNASNRFSAVATLSDGTLASLTAPSLKWTATGGTVDQTGLFTAGSVPGDYVAIATASNGVADTAAVTVTATPIAPIRLALSPSITTLAEGSSAQFTVAGKAADGSTVGVAPTFTATGGVVTAGGVYTAGTSPGAFAVVATDSTTGLADTSTVTVTVPTPILPTQLVLSPSTATLVEGASTQFTAVGKATDGSAVAVYPKFTVSGGSVTASGVYTAGTTPGAFTVIATDSSSGLADTSTVTVTAPAPTLGAVDMTPATVSLVAGGTQQFTATGTMSDGSTSTIAVAFSATGGTITSAGLYTAGSSAGNYRVVAVQTGGTLADTSTVTITTASTPPPPPPPPPSGSCNRTVNVGTVAALTSALSGAQPGDCIMLSAGTYSLTGNLSFARSGTSAAPITIQGTGSGTVIDGTGALRNISITGSYLRFSGLRFTNLGVQGLWCQGMTYSVFDNVEIDHTQQVGIRLKDGSHHNVIQNSRFHDTGILHPYWGEAIYVGNSGDTNFPLQFTNTDNQILGNKFGPNVRSQAVDVKEGSDRTVIRGNDIDGTGTEMWRSEGSVSLIDVIASYVTIEGNSLRYGAPQGVSFYAPKTVTMTGNVARNNTIDLANIHNVTDRPFYAFNLTASTTGGRVLVKCDNKVTNGTFSNVACSP